MGMAVASVSLPREYAGDSVMMRRDDEEEGRMMMMMMGWDGIR